VNRFAHVMRWGLLVVWLAGCGAMPAPEGLEPYWIRPGVNRPASEAVSLLHYFDYLRGLPAAEQEVEKALQRQAWIEDRSDFQRIRYAVALSGPTASAAEHRQAFELLEPLARDPEDPDSELHLLAAVLFRAQDSERARLAAEKQLERTLDSMKNLERRLEAMKGLERRLEAMKELERRLEELERKLATMQEIERKLEAMKEIERTLLQRNRGETPGTKP
jgi:tetratricopeptide (TPR) repeat protein